MAFENIDVTIGEQPVKMVDTKRAHIVCEKLMVKITFDNKNEEIIIPKSEVKKLLQELYVE